MTSPPAAIQSSTRTPRFARSAVDYAAHRPAFAPRLFEKLRAIGVGSPGQRILDIGAGTGLLGRGFLAAGAKVIECEPSVDLLRMAESPYRVAAAAETLPFEDHSFEAVTAAQCWHWFDRVAAPREIRRVLQPGGIIAIIYQTHLPLENTLAHATEELILKHRPRWRHAGAVGVNGQALKDLQSAGFVEIESFTFDVLISFTPIAWRGYVRTWSAVGPSMSADMLVRFDDELAELLATSRWAASEHFVPHRVFVASARSPSAHRSL